MICIKLRRYDKEAKLIECDDLSIPCDQSPGLLRGGGWNKCLCWRAQEVPTDAFCLLAKEDDEAPRRVA